MIAVHGRLAGNFLLCFFLLFASGCASTGKTVKNLAKSDIGMVSEAHFQFTQLLLKDLTEKLYRRNPIQLTKGSLHTIEERVAQIFLSQNSHEYSELKNRQGIAAIELAFDLAYSGDRVFALMAGLTEMINHSYGYRSEFYILDKSLDESHLYKSARNVEVLMWMLAKRVDLQGKPLILSNSLVGGGQVNMSYERLLGKLVATQDLMAVITAQKNQRLLNTVVHNVASMTFMPF